MQCSCCRTADLSGATPFLNLTAAFGILSTTIYNPKCLQIYPITRIGVISYGIYVYHLPLLIALRQTNMSRVLSSFQPTSRLLYLCRGGELSLAGNAISSTSKIRKEWLLTSVPSE